MKKFWEHWIGRGRRLGEGNRAAKQGSRGRQQRDGWTNEGRTPDGFVSFAVLLLFQVIFGGTFFAQLFVEGVSTAESQGTITTRTTRRNTRRESDRSPSTAETRPTVAEVCWRRRRRRPSHGGAVLFQRPCLTATITRSATTPRHHRTTHNHACGVQQHRRCTGPRRRRRKKTREASQQHHRGQRASRPTMVATAARRGAGSATLGSPASGFRVQGSEIPTQAGR